MVLWSGVWLFVTERRSSGCSRERGDSVEGSGFEVEWRGLTLAVEESCGGWWLPAVDVVI
jgi:hypothetical protein